MINKIIHEALLDHDFIEKEKADLTSFYIRESGPAIRFAILHKLNELLEPANLNNYINRLIPSFFIDQPAFKKNCDLICIHRLNELADFKSCEEKIFAIEEDPHFFKKFILYYSDAEENEIENSSYADLKEVINEKHQFKLYKNDPLAPTKYSVAARIFIKLPFLKLPSTTNDLFSLRSQIREAVAEHDLKPTHKIIQRLTENNMDELVKELIKNELENKED